VRRPLTGEPLPLDLLNTTTWSQDLLADEPGTRAWLDEHGFDAPAGERARHALVHTRETLRAHLARDAGAIEGVNAILARGGRLAGAVDVRGRTRRTARPARGPGPALREPGLRPVVPGHDPARHAAVVLDGDLRQSGQGDPARARAPHHAAGDAVSRRDPARSHVAREGDRARRWGVMRP
jgi:hypothetical protein